MSYLVFDTGFYMNIAKAIGENGEDVYYFVDWVEPYPRIEKYIVGDGFIEFVKIIDIGETLMGTEVIVFPDVGYGGLADNLRFQNKYVFGASGGGQKLELDRAYMHEIVTELGIKRPSTKIVYGVEELKRTVTGGKKFVKVSTFRGNMETVKIEKPEEIEVVIDEASFGAYANDMELIVEDAVEGVEIGADVLFNGKEFIKPYLLGIEIKGKANYSVWTEESILDDELLNKIAPYLEKTGYRGTISFEGILNKDGFYLIDVTARYPFPADGILTKTIENPYSEIVEAVAKGEYPEIKPKAKYAGEIVLYTGVHDRWLSIDIEPRIEDKINFKNVVYKDGIYWHIPGDIVGSIVEYGNSFEEVQKKLEETMKNIWYQEMIYNLDAYKEFEERKEQLKNIFGYDIIV